MSESLIQVQNVSKKFCRNFRRSLCYGLSDIYSELTGRDVSPVLREQEFWALKGISFEVKRGECLALLGRNGAGKTSLLKALNGLFKPTEGKITMRGKVGALIALGAGFNPVLTGRENIYVNGAILGLTRHELDKKISEIIDFAELQEVIDTPVQNYSSGMQMRLGFSIATALEPDILLLDEVLAVGDTAFRVKCFERIGRILKESAVIFVSHDVVQVSRICNRVLVLQQGVPSYLGETEEGVERYCEEISKAQKMTSMTKLIPEITECKVTLEQSQLSRGESLTVYLKITSNEVLTPGLCLLALATQDTFPAQCEFTHLLPTISKGETVCKISVGPIHLRRDQYFVCITILDETKKQTFIHALNVAEVTVSGPRGYGVAYQPPVLSALSFQDSKEKILSKP